MHLSEFRFHHLGLAVRQPEMAQAFLRAQGYDVSDTLFDEAQNVNAAICTHRTEPMVEILWPTGTKGPLDGLLQRNSGGIVYHLCYEVGNLARALAQFEAAGLTAICISEPKSAPLFGNRNVSFYNVVGMGLIEILSDAPSESRIP